MRIHVALRFDKGYIGHPYWPEREQVISIRKSSGVDRARSEAKRTATLNAWLTAHDMTREAYEQLVARANRPFYTAADGEIVIPAHQLHGCMGATAAVAPAAVRLAKPEQIRTFIEWQDLETGKHKADGQYSRFVRNPLTNQRRLEVNDYIEDFLATGTLWLTAEDREKRAREFIAFGGREIGLGAARKMGWGRFVLEDWQPQ
jgi:hypothetical protein